MFINKNYPPKCSYIHETITLYLRQGREGLYFLVKFIFFRIKVKLYDMHGQVDVQFWT